MADYPQSLHIAWMSLQTLLHQNKDEDYQSYTMKIGCNAAGDAKFETNYLGLTNVTVGKCLGTDGELVSFENYNWKVHLLSVTGKVIYTQ